MSAVVRWAWLPELVALIALLAELRSAVARTGTSSQNQESPALSGSSTGRQRGRCFRVASQLAYRASDRQFRQNYLPFKLPQSSEEIADPHNLVSMSGSNGGLIGLAGLAGICFAVLARSGAAKGIPPVEPRDGCLESLVFLGGGLAHLCVMGPDFGNDELLALLSLLLVGWLLVVVLCQSLFDCEPDSIVLASAGVVLIVHLLGAAASDAGDRANIAVRGGTWFGSQGSSWPVNHEPVRPTAP